MAEKELTPDVVYKALVGLRKKKSELESLPRPLTRGQAITEEKLTTANVPDWVKNIFGDDERVRNERNASREWARQRKAGDHASQEWLDQHPYEGRRGTGGAQDVLKSVLSVSEQNGSTPRWLVQSISNTRENPYAAEFVSRIAVLPETLQNDPYFLLREAKRFSSSVHWGDLSNEGKRETVTLINRTLAHIEEMIPDNPDFIADITIGTPPPDLREIVLPEATFGPTKIDKDIFVGLPLRDGLSPDVRNALDKIEEHGVNNPTDSLNQDKLSVWAGRLREDSRDTPENQQIFDEYKIRLKEHERHIQGEARLLENEERNRLNAERRAMEYEAQEEEAVPNQINLSRLEIEAFKKDPQGTIDRMLGQLEQALLNDPENQQAQRTSRRLEMQLDYLLSDEFDLQRPVFLDRRALTVAEKTRIREDFRVSLGRGEANLKNKLLENYTTRLGAVQFMMSLSSSAEIGGDNSNFRRFLVSRMKERNFFGMDGLYGGLVGDASHLLQRMYESKLFKDDKLKFLSHKDLLDSIDELKVFMKDHPEMYMDRFENYVRGVYFEDRPVANNKVTPLGADWSKMTDAEKRQHYNDAVDAIALLATERQVMFLETVGVGIRGAGPLAEEKYIGGHSTYLTKDKLEQLFRPLRYKVEKWGSGIGIPAGEKAFFKKMAEMHAAAAPEIKQWGEETGKKLYNDATHLNLQHKLEKHLREIKTNPTAKFEDLGTNDAEKKALKRILGEIQYIYFFNPEAPTDNTKFMEFVLKNFSEKTLIKQATVSCAIDIADSHLVHPYMIFESGWRRSETNMQITENLTQIFGEDNIKGLFVANDITGKSLEYFFTKFGEDNVEKRFALLDKLKNGAKYKPHDLAQVLHERDSAWLNKWYKNHKEGDQSLSGILSETSFNATLLQREMMADLQPSIDYGKGLGGLSPYQRQIVERVFAGIYNPSEDIRRLYYDKYSGDSAFKKLLFGDENAAVQDFTSLTNDQERLLVQEIRKNYAEVDQIRGKITENIDKHFRIEKGLSDFLINNDGNAPEETLNLLKHAGSKVKDEKDESKSKYGAIRELCDTRYGPLLSKPRGSDDLPLDLLQYPERIERRVLELAEMGKIEFMDKSTQDTLNKLLVKIQNGTYKRPRPIADYFSTKGLDVQSGMAIRTWRDLGSAEQALTALFELVKPGNAEKLDEFAEALFKIVAPYQGPDVAGMAVVQMVGTWEAEAKAFPFTERLQDSSDFKRYYGSESVAMGVDTLRHVWEKVQARIGKISKNAPKAMGLLEVTESEAGISSWDVIIGRRSWFKKPLMRILGEERLNQFVEFLNERMPSGITFNLRVPLWGIFIIGFLIMYLATEAGKSEKEKSH